MKFIRGIATRDICCMLTHTCWHRHNKATCAQTKGLMEQVLANKTTTYPLLFDFCLHMLKLHVTYVCRHNKGSYVQTKGIMEQVLANKMTPAT